MTTNLSTLIGEIFYLPLLIYLSILLLSCAWLYVWTEQYTSGSEAQPFSIATLLRPFSEKGFLATFRRIRFSREPNVSVGDLFTSPQEFLYLGVTLVVTAFFFGRNLLNAKKSHCPENINDAPFYYTMGIGMGIPVVLLVVSMMFNSHKSFRSNIEPYFLFLTAVGFIVAGSVMVKQLQGAYMPILFVVGYVLLCRIMYLGIFTSGAKGGYTVMGLCLFGISFCIFVGLIYGNTYLKYMNPTLQDCPSG